MAIENERKFLHNLANPMAIAQGNIKITLRKLEKDPDSLSVNELLDRLTKASDAFDRITEMMAERRAIIIQAEVELSDHAS